MQLCVCALSFLYAVVATFFLYSAIALIALSFVYLYVPETRGVAMEQIPELFPAHRQTHRGQRGTRNRETEGEGNQQTERKDGEEQRREQGEEHSREGRERRESRESEMQEEDRLFTPQQR